MKTKHTQGEWIMDIKGWINSNPQSIHIQLNSENHFSGKSIAKINIVCGGEYDSFNYDLEEANANAKLIAAAPDLLDALNNICKRLDYTNLSERDTFKQLYLNAIEAINKATK